MSIVGSLSFDPVLQHYCGYEEENELTCITFAQNTARKIVEGKSVHVVLAEK